MFEFECSVHFIRQLDGQSDGELTNKRAVITLPYFLTVLIKVLCCRHRSFLFIYIQYIILNTCFNTLTFHRYIYSTITGYM